MMEQIRMDEYCSSVRDGTHDTPKPSENGYYLVTSKAIGKHEIDFSGCYRISKIDYTNINKRSKVDQWDVIMSMIGTVGRLHLVQQEPDYAIKNIALFKIGNESRAKWLYYYLSTPAVQNYFELVASGTSQHFVGLGDLRKFKIENYRRESERITEILSAYDDLIALNNQRIKVLEQMAENLYKEWFVRFRFPGHESTVFDGGIPKGWLVKKVRDIVRRLPFGTLYKTENTEPEGKIIVIDQSQNEYVGFHNNEPSHVATPTVPIMLFGDHSCKYQLMVTPFSLSENVVPFVGDDVLTAYLFYLIRGIVETTEYKRHWTELMAKKVLVAPFDLQKRFVDYVTTINVAIQKQREVNRKLVKQRDLLLPRLMSGKLEVK